MSINITVVGTEEVVGRLRGASQQVRTALAKAMMEQWYGLQSYIVESKLSGQVLKRVTGVLRSSINVGGAQSATQFIDSGQGDLVGRVGTKVVYGAVHEYGGRINIRAHERRITQVFGKPVEPHSIHVREHSANYPERSFLRSGLADLSDQIKSNIADSMRSALG